MSGQKSLKKSLSKECITKNGDVKKQKLNGDENLPQINPNIIKHLDKIKNSYSINKDDIIKNEEEELFEMISAPFKVAQFRNFVQDSTNEFLSQLKSEIVQLDYAEKNNDLYRFRQSKDLKNYDSGAIDQFCKFLSQDVLPFMKRLTGIELNETIDITASVYEENDHLLCHDDELEGRRIAFILYLVPEWDSSDGGALDLFECDSDYQPLNVAKSIIPKWNSFLFFEVTPTSFHQVAEILSDTKTRLSINGWFHGSPIQRPEPFIEPAFVLSEPGDIDEEMLRSWIKPTFLDEETQLNIQAEFSERSEIALSDFFFEDKYIELSRALKDCESIKWELTLPPNKRRYQRAIIDDDESCPVIVKEAFNLFKSEAMFIILSNLTGLKLHKLAITDSGSDDDEDDNDDDDSDQDDQDKQNTESDLNCKCRGEVRLWTSKNYTLIHDYAAETSEGAALDVVVHFNTENDNEFAKENGGFISYIAKDEDEELLTIEPTFNTLNIVYRDEGTTRFVKYINSKFNDVFHDMSFVYYQ